MPIPDLCEIQSLLDRAMWPERMVGAQMLEHIRRGRKIGEGKWQHFSRRLDASVKLYAARAAALPKWTFPPELPISQRADEIIEALRTHPVVVIAGETGSGKTTQLPKMCLAAGLGIAGKIACTQPRRVAALSVSRRIAEELNVNWGKEVGAKIRFTDRTGPETLIKMMTDGMLLAEVQADPDLREYDAILVDEAHERSLNIDFLLGYLQTLRVRRPELRIIITSATIDTAAFSRAFGDAPIVSVTGRTYPVDIRYEPFDEQAEERGDFTYLDGAASAVQEVVQENRPGDVLVFLPGEKDIRDLRGVLEDRRLGRVEVLPLFGRLSNAEQERIFARTTARKIILSTNIAETSLTIPGIRYVIDAGLARVSRYHARTHTRRLPIEPVAQSSADQRAGRAGRVEAGVCIRLYSEKDYLARPRYATPELLRANLAEVILRMIAFGLGRVEDFPFLDPPKPAAIHAGYELLQDLGALDAERTLTSLGAELARLPCDPTVGRMLLQARQEGCLREVLVIAAGLSIQDPRERPAEAQEEADRMHARFRHAESDFLSLLKIWDSYHEQLEALTQNQLRRFCRQHFLSYLRMREWRDVHAQLSQVMRELGTKKQGAVDADYDSIHRAILTGLFAQVAHREAGNHYRATHQRPVMVYPGSALFDKTAAKAERKKFKGQQKPATVSGNRTPPWIVCAEWMETSRLFARTVARIEPPWLEELAAHIITVSHLEPSWDKRGERAVIREKRHLYGLEISVRRIGLERIDPEAARLIFIREGLVGGTIHTPLEWYERNQEVRAEVEEQQTRLRQASVWQLDERVERFYRERLPLVSSVVDLKKWWRRATTEERAQLELRIEDLLSIRDEDLEAYPEKLELPGVTLSLNYAYKPGAEDDGATLRVPFSALTQLDAAMLDWAVPGFARERIQHLLKSLPKDIRRQLHPLGEKADVLATWVSPDRGPLQDQLTQLIKEHFGILLWAGAWDGRSVPVHLRPRLAVVDADNQILAEGRDFASVRTAIDAVEQGSGVTADRQRKEREVIWFKARGQYEQPDLSSWGKRDLPEKIEIGHIAGLPVWAWPGLEVIDETRLDLRLFPSREAALSASARGFPSLIGKLLAKELAWAERELSRELKRVKLNLVGFLPWPTAERGAFACLRAAILPRTPPIALTAEVVGSAVASAQNQLCGWAPRFIDQLDEILGQRRRLKSLEDPHGIVGATLERLLPVRFLETTPTKQFAELPRYLEAARLRAEKARRDPARDRKRIEVVKRFEQQLAALRCASPEREAFFWSLEEFRVSLFAQQLGTRQKTSPTILEELWRCAQTAESRSSGGGLSLSSASPTSADSASPLSATTRSASGPPPQQRDLEALKRLWEG